MLYNVETRRFGGDGLQNMSLSRDITEVPHSPPTLQVSFIASRLGVGDALAAVVAEHAFGRFHGRSSR